MKNTDTNPGLEGLVVAESAVSEVDGERGRLVIAGLDVEQLAATHTFEQAAKRILTFDVDTSAGRAAAWEMLPRLGDALDHDDGMDALRTGLAHLRATGDDKTDALAAIAAAPVFV